MAGYTLEILPKSFQEMALSVIVGRKYRMLSELSTGEVIIP
jgi:hypothetical protein